MKDRLKQIYQDLACGRLTKDEALTRIGDLKLGGSESSGDLLVLAPGWETVNAEPGAHRAYASFIEKHIVLCEAFSSSIALRDAIGAERECQAIAPAGDIAQRYGECARALLATCQSVLKRKPKGDVLIQLLVPDSDEISVLAGLGGLLKTASLENPRIKGQVILSDPGLPAAELVGQLTQSEALCSCALLRYRDGRAYVSRWRELPEGSGPVPAAFKDGGVYLITGGLGGLGRLFAREILRQTVDSRVIVTGRSALTAEKEALVSELASGTKGLEYRVLDVADETQVRQVLAEVRGAHHRLDGIVHCAGVVADNFIMNKTAEEFARVLAPKVAGGYSLELASREMDLDFLVLFSSAASVLGNVGQVDYAAANGFLDRLAVLRNQLVDNGQCTGRAVAINWPLWEEGGMSVNAQMLAIQHESTGMTPLATAAGMRAFRRCLAHGASQLLVLAGNAAKLRATVLAEDTGIATSPRAPPLALGESNAVLADRVQAFLCEQLTVFLKLPDGELGPHVPLEKYGIDSIRAVGLTRALEQWFGLLPKTLFFEYQCVAELAEYFLQSFPDTLVSLFATQRDALDDPPSDHEDPSPSTASRPQRDLQDKPLSATAPALRSVPHQEGIAIIGLSGRYPNSFNVAEFWRNLRAGADCIVEVPPERWDWREYYSEDHGKPRAHRSKWGGFIEGVGEFDCRFFNVAPRDAGEMDPQERLFLQHAWMAIEDAGYIRADLQIPDDDDLPAQVGVYAGVMYGEYQLSGSLASVANRVSYFLNLHGPSMTLDTMCSSSLTAIHLACQDLKQGRTSLAIAGGVNVSIDPNKYAMLSAGQFISTEGRCESFGEGSGGYIPGEGVGVVVLKRLAEAIRDGDHIYGVVRGSALSHGGKTSGFSVPNPQAQASAIGRALSEAGIDPRHVSYVEAHGTGTKLGDPIEIAALTKVFRRATADTGFCAIGSVKSNIGHCESAAGIAGLTKVLLQMQHRTIVPSLHSSKLNPFIDFASGPFVVSQTLRRWEAPVIDGVALPRIAGISSFGAGGSNAHLIVQDYQAPAATNLAPAYPLIFPLSARTDEQLKQRARDLLSFLRRDKQEGVGCGCAACGARPDLAATAHTLQVGREAMAHRAAFVAESPEQLMEQLAAFSEERQAAAVYSGTAATGVGAPGAAAADLARMMRAEPDALAQSWVQGQALEWRRSYLDVPPRRISLPVYPFARDRHWKERPKAPDAAGEVAWLHPLLERNTSDMREHRYSTSLHGDEPFLEAGTLPGLTTLEMARAAVAQALPQPPPGTVLELRQVLWSRDAMVGGPRTLHLALLSEAELPCGYELYTREDGEDVVLLGQGDVVFSAASTVPPVALEPLRERLARVAVVAPGIEALYRNDEEVLVRVRRPAAETSREEGYVFHPAVLAGVLEGIAVLLALDGASSAELLRPQELELLRVLGGCEEEMLAWVRRVPGSEGRVDVELCTSDGRVCAQIRGLQCRRELRAQPVPAATRVTGEGVEIAMGEGRGDEGRGGEKPAGIKLGRPAGFSGVMGAVKGRLRIKLPRPGVRGGGWEEAGEMQQRVRLYEHGGGLFEIRLIDHRVGAAWVEQFKRALAVVRERGAAKAVIVSGGEGEFLHGGGQGQEEEELSGELYEAVAGFEYPLIAAMGGDASGAGFLVGALCDFMVCSREGRYGYAEGGADFYPTAGEERFFRERFGEARAVDFLYRREPSSGERLRERGWSCAIVPREEVEAQAKRLGARLVEKPAAALRLLKRHLGREFEEGVGGLREGGREGSAVPEVAEGVEPLREPSRPWQLERAGAVMVARLGRPGPGAGELGIEESFRPEEWLLYIKESIARAESAAGCTAVVLAGSGGADFLPVAGAAESGEVARALQGLFEQTRLPVVAALEGGARGFGWLVGQLSDAAVYEAAASYCAAPLLSEVGLAQTAAAIFCRRLGASLGQEALLSETTYTGRALEEGNRALIVRQGAQVLEAALGLGERLGRLPAATVRSLKRAPRAPLEQAPAGAEDTLIRAAESGAQRGGGIPLASATVSAIAQEDGVVVVRMEERREKNLFTEPLVAGLNEVFAHIARTPSCKVVVLTGYEQYFATGGTRDSLLAIQQGRAHFTDQKVYQLALDCEVPVIAAMQGHAIGAGWCLGMFADVPVLAEESQYSSPYMRYGFTPGAGATLVLPAKIGHDLARESLLGAQEYTGAELKARGVPLPVLPRAEVLPAALALAKRIARHPRGSLVALKRERVAPLRRQLEDIYRRELAMHEQTFVGQSQVLEGIRLHYADSDGVETDAAPEANRGLVKIGGSNGEVSTAITARLKTLLAHELRMGEEEIEEDAPFVDLGLDSINGVSWIRKINEQYRTKIEATKVYSHPTLSAFAAYVQQVAEKQGSLAVVTAGDMPPSSRVAKSGRALALSAAGVAQLVSRRRRARGVGAPAVQGGAAIAVIGMAGRFPRARTVAEFWENVADGRDCISEVAVERWDLGIYYRAGEPVAGKTNSKWLGALEEYDRFDPLFFDISPKEAREMDPQQRVFLQTCWHGIEHAGYAPHSLSGSKCGVFVGCGTGDYHRWSRDEQLNAHSFMGNSSSILAARISYFLNLRGPCLSIDTACSSSLVAIASACDSLSSRASDVALAGGVYVMAGPGMHIQTSQAGMLSAEGRCFAFDQRANGIVPGEGVGVVVLKRLEDAERDRDLILGVIRGWGVNQDGKSNGITAPNADAQARLQQEVYEKYRIDPEQIQLIETHGTGTKLGDPIEIDGLKTSFGKFTTRQGYCALGSVKSNIGHCLTAAGISGFIKLLLALQHKQLPPTIHFSQLNEHIRLEGSPFYINDQLRDWSVAGGERRQAAISSFGFSGTNAHVVVAEHAAGSARAAARVRTPVIVALSARTDGQLERGARDLLEYLAAKEGSEADLEALAYTLQVGRDPMQERLGVVADSAEQLRQRLGAYLAGEREVQGVRRGCVREHRESIGLLNRDEEIRALLMEHWVARQQLDKLLELWTKGLDLDWTALYGEGYPPQRLRLPLLYPFAKERYWLDGVEAPDVQDRSQRLHPLVHRNTSDLRQQRYSSRFTGTEFFLLPSAAGAARTPPRKELPATACLEMIRAAIADAAGEPGADEVLELRGMVWPAALLVAPEETVTVALAEREEDADEIAFEILSGRDGEESLNCRGWAVYRQREARPQVPSARLQEAMDAGRLEAQTLHERLAAQGLEYGPAHRGIKSIRLAEDELLAELELPAALSGTACEYALHPCHLEAAVQCCLVLVAGQRGTEVALLRLVSLENLQLLGPCTGPMLASVRQAGNDDERLFDVDFFDAEGYPRLTLTGLSFDAAASAADPSEIGSPVALAEAAPLRAPTRREQATELCYRECWVKDDAPNAPRSEWPAGELIVFADEKLKHETEENAAEVAAGITWVLPSAQFREVPGEGFYCRVTGDDLRAVLDHAVRDGDAPNKRAEITLVYTWARDRGAMGVHDLFRVFKVLGAYPDTTINLLLVGRYDSSREDSIWDYSWIGFQRSLGKLLPRTRVSFLLTDTADADIGQIGGALSSGGVVWHSKGNKYRLSIEAIENLTATPEMPLRHMGRYLVTGGCGALGFAFAHYLAQHCRAELLLIGRSTQNADIEEKLHQLTQAGATSVEYQSVDVGDDSAVQDLAKRISGRLTGIIHAAGLESDKEYSAKTSQEIDAVLRPKTIGTMNLDRAFGGQELDFVCYFSSSAAMLGDFGACDYAIANRYLMGHAYYRNARAGNTCKTFVMNWPLWKDGRMGYRNTEEAARYLKMCAQDFGQTPLETAAGTEMWKRILRSDQTQSLIMVGRPRGVARLLRRVYRNGAFGIAEPPDAKRESDGTGNPYDYANRVEEVYSLVLPSVTSEMEYLSFCPFDERRAGFSMSKVYLNPKKYPEDRRYVTEKQSEMRRVLFAKEDFSQIRSILDFGCGHGTDVIQLGQLFDGVSVHGFTISQAQAVLGKSRIRDNGLSSRVEIQHRDSAGDEFPSNYDLIVGIEVCPHIEDKDALFGNIRRHLNKNGVLLLIDVIANTGDGIVAADTGMYIPNKPQWAELVSRFQLEVDEYIDASPQIANFLHDPDVANNVANLPEAVRKTYESYAEASGALARGDISYVLVRLKRNDTAATDQLLADNWKKMAVPTPYPLAAEKVRTAGTGVYPRHELKPAVNEAAGPGRHPREKASVRAPVRRKDANFTATGVVFQPLISGRKLHDELRSSLAEVLQVSLTEIDLQESFGDLGLDSFLGLEWVTKINQRYGTKLPNLVVYDYPTIKDMANLVAKEVARLAPAVEPIPSLRDDSNNVSVGGAPAVRDSTTRAVRRKGRRKTAAGDLSSRTDKIAIVGMAGRYPQAENLHRYWGNLVEGKNAIVEIPPSRWDANSIYEANSRTKGRICSKWLGMLEDVECFDPLFFRISPNEAKHIDPQHRLFLQEAYKAFEDAGYAPEALNNAKCGVYLGIASNEYSILLTRKNIQSDSVTGNSHAIGAARIAYHLNLKGPAISVDTACSSSLVAVHVACQALRSGEIDMALAGGVSVWLTADSYLAMCQAGMLSPDGQCKAFDDAANGIVVGEGVGAVVLKRLEDAQRNGDLIYGVILGSGINQDGKTNGITAPSVNSQMELEREVYAKNGIDPDSITYVETHGTGTKLGDPIELTALAEAFRQKTQRKNYCAVGSVKSNIGHTAAAAGIASLHKVLLSMRHATLVPTLHVQKENGQFDFADSPFYINKETRAWQVPSGTLRRAAVSSFGFSGTNAHLVVEEYSGAGDDRDARAATTERAMIPLSARTREQLRRKVEELLAWFEGRDENEGLGSLAYTLQTGREAMEERLGIIASSAAELTAKLRGYLEARADADTYQGRVKVGEEALADFMRDEEVRVVIGRWLRVGDVARLMSLWVKGGELDWHLLYAKRPHKISLPTYPFEKERCWLDADLDVPPHESAHHPEKAAETVATALHESSSSIRTGLQAMLGATGKEWVSLSEEWQSATLEHDGEWLEKIESKSNHRILVIGEDAREFDSIRRFCETLARTTGGKKDIWRVDYLPERVTAEAMSASLSSVLGDSHEAVVVFLYLSRVHEAMAAHQLETVYTWVQKFLQEAHAREIAFYCCYSRSDDRGRLFGEGLTGLLKSAMGEGSSHAYRSIGFDTDDLSINRVARRTVQEWLCDRGSRGRANAVMVRDAAQGRQELRMLERFDLPPARDAPAFRQDGTYLVVGTLGKVGEAVCRELGRRYRAKLIILSRPPPDRAREIVARIEAAGASVEYHSVDVADIAALTNEMDRIRTDGMVINGSIDIATELVDGCPITSASSELPANIGTTVSATMNLDEVLADAELDFFIVFSSMTSFGSKGPADYAYATAFQNALIRDRNRLVEKGARKGRGIALCWGQWQIDRATSDEVMSNRVRKPNDVGTDAIDPTSAFRAIELALTDNREVSAYIAVTEKKTALRMLGVESTRHVDQEAIVARIDERERKRAARTASGTYLDDVPLARLPGSLPEETARPSGGVEREQAVTRVPETNGRPAPAFATNGSGLADEPSVTSSQLAAPMRVTTSERVLVSMEKVLGIKKEAIEPDRCFQDYGLDSLTAVQLTTALEKEFGRYVPPIWLTEYSNLSALSKQIAATI